MNRIKELRQKNNWRQEDLAQRLHISYKAVGHYETGRRGLDVETIEKLCDIFDVSADYLLGRSEHTSPDLSVEEWALVSAYRKADQDAKDMVRLALKRWTAAKPMDKDAAS